MARLFSSEIVRPVVLVCLPQSPSLSETGRVLPPAFVVLLTGWLGKAPRKLIQTGDPARPLFVGEVLECLDGTGQ